MSFKSIFSTLVSFALPWTGDIVMLIGIDRDMCGKLSTDEVSLLESESSSSSSLLS